MDAGGHPESSVRPRQGGVHGWLAGRDLAYVGGATATHVRMGEPFFFPVVFGVLVWAALYPFDERLRALLPLRR